MKLKLILQKVILPVLTVFAVQYAYAQNSWNTAAIFNGSSYFASMDNMVNSTSGEMTVEFWVKLYGSNENVAIIGKNQFRIMTSSNNVRIQVNGTTQLTSMGKIDSGKWTHVAVTFSNTNNAIRVYLNGNLDNVLTTFSGSFTATNDSLIIGKNPYVSNLHGELDEVRIWKTVRTQSEIQNNMRVHLPWYSTANYDANLIFCQTYEFDVYSPGIYFPYGGTKGVFSGEILGTSPSKTVLHNNSMFFNGSSYLETSSANDANISLTGPITVEAWIYPTSLMGTQTILDLTSGGTGGFKLTLESSGKLSWVMTQYGTSTKVLELNKWYHVAVVCGTPASGNQIATFYINGVPDNGYNFSELVANTGKLRIGANHSSTANFNGFIDEVRISNYAKSTSELQRYLHTPILYANKPASPKSTVAYNFDGNVHSGTRLGSLLKNNGCRFSYASDPGSPLFHLGDVHELTLDSMVTKNSFKPIPSSGTAGFTYDSVSIPQSITLNENNIKVFYSLYHESTSDLRIELISPFGDSVMLLSQVSFPSRNITAMFNNGSAVLNGTGIADIAPLFGTSEKFTKFNGKNSQGIWRLKITDLNNGNKGVLHSWGLILNGSPFVNNIKQLQTAGNINVYPNPSFDRAVTLQVPETELSGSTIRFTNFTGQNVYELTPQNCGNSIQIKLPENIKSGSYIVTIQKGNKTYRSKLVLN